MRIDQFFEENPRFQETTRENYARHLRNLEAWADTMQIEIAQLSCEKFQAFLKSKPWGNSMQRGSLYALRSYFSWNGCKDHPIVIADKLLPKLEATNKRFLSIDDFNKLLAACDTSQGGLALRNQAILHVLFDSMVRASELCDIQLDDCKTIKIEDENGEHLLDANGNPTERLTGIFRVRTKAKANSGERHYEWKEINPNGSLNALNAWLEVRKKYALPNDPYLFVGQVQTDMETGEYKAGGTKLTRHGLQATLNRPGKRAGVKVSAHDFRRGSATHEHRNGRDLFEIMDTGGWSSMQVLRGYIEETSAEERQARRFSKEAA